MRVFSIFPAILLILGMSAAPAYSEKVLDMTAAKALRRLPKAESERLVRIVAIGATPVPESWHILSYDPESEAGIKERIVANGVISDGVEASEYASYLTEDDVIERRKVKIDTDRLFRTANRYALANEMMVSSMNYTLEKNEDGDAVWQVDCIDESDAVAGSLAIAADTGEVLSQEGFAIEPTAAPAKPTKIRKGALKLTTEAEPVVSAENTEDASDSGEIDNHEAKGSREQGVAKSSTEKKSHGTRARSVRRGRRPDGGDVARTVTRPVRRVLRRVLPF